MNKGALERQRAISSKRDSSILRSRMQRDLMRSTEVEYENNEDKQKLNLSVKERQEQVQLPASITRHISKKILENDIITSSFSPEKCNMLIFSLSHKIIRQSFKYKIISKWNTNKV